MLVCAWYSNANLVDPIFSQNLNFESETYIFEDQAFIFDQRLVFEMDSLCLGHCRFQIL